MEITIVDFIFCHPKSNYGVTLRLQIEFNWIQRLRTMLSMGLNSKDRTPLETHCRSWKTEKITKSRLLLANNDNRDIDGSLAITRTECD